MFTKIKSVKNQLLFWIVVIITYIVYTDKVEFLPLVQNLAWAVLGYFGANTFQKKIFADQHKEAK